MTKFRCVKLEMSVTVQRRYKTLQDMASSSGYDIRTPDPLPRGCVAAYSYASNYKLEQMMDQISKSDAFALAHYGKKPVHFHDYLPGVPALEKLIDFAREGSIKAVVFKSVDTFVFCREHKLAGYLVAFRDAGVAIHFAVGLNEMLGGTSLAIPNSPGGSLRPMSHPAAL